MIALLLSISFFAFSHIPCKQLIGTLTFSDALSTETESGEVPDFGGNKGAEKEERALAQSRLSTTGTHCSRARCFFPLF